MQSLQSDFKRGAAMGIGFMLAVSLFMTAFAWADPLHVFRERQVLSAGSMNANFRKLTPIGTIVGWHKSLGGVPGLNTGEWLECNGQTVTDSESPLNGRTLPNLNNPRPDPAGGAANTFSRGSFLRGHTSSGVFQDDALQGHFHNLFKAPNILEWRNVAPAGVSNTVPGNLDGESFGSTASNYQVQAPRSDGTSGVPRTATENRPVNMSVVWIIRVK